MRAGLYLHALRTARPRQLQARARRPLARRRFRAGQAPELVPAGGAAEFWRSAAFDSTTLAGSGSERLRSFHAQYGEDALQLARLGDGAAARAAMETWIELHPPRLSDAWHPYPLATRVGNWVAAMALAPESATRAVGESLWRQLQYLERNVEDDILGNHVIRNARALLLGGAAFSSDRLLERGGQLLRRELPEQVLSDGGHYERSPAYHLVVLRDLFEVEATVPGSVPAEVLERMRRFAAFLSRPDGEPALFNDGTLDLAPKLDLPTASEGLAVFPETGYAVWRRAGLWLAFDCGPPSPPYLPAHAHADALSVQLWIDGKPVLVDPGMPTYEPGTERDWFRGTRAHSTVSVDGDQFDLWGAFRSGPLPSVELLEASATDLVAAVTGRTGVRHVRRVHLDGGQLVIQDRLEGKGERTLESSLQFAPGGEAEAATHGPVQPDRERRWVSERFFERTAAPALVVREERSLPAELGWTIPLR
jgi:heparinase II/III-like protein